MSSTDEAPREEADCPVCAGHALPDASARAFLGLEAAGHPCIVLHCPSCGVRWLDPYPPPTGPQLYDYAYYESPEQGPRYSAQKREMAGCYAERAHHFRSLGVTAGLLDVGCGTGDFLIAAREAGIFGRGAELSEYAAITAAQAGLDVWHGALDTFPSEMQSHAALHCSHVLEHVEDLHLFLGRVHDLLVPGAPVYFEVPLQFDGVLDRLKAWRGQRYPFSVFSIHHHYFSTPQSLRAALEANGFAIDAVNTFLASRHSGRDPGLPKWAVQSLLWAADRIASAGDVIAVWGRRR